MLNSTAMKLVIIAACIICAVVFLYPLWCRKIILTLESQFHKESYSSISSGCDICITNIGTYSFNLIVLSAEQKRNLFKYVLSSNYDTQNGSPSSEQQHMGLALLGQLNRDISESSCYGQIKRETHDKESDDVIVVGTLNTSRPYAVFSTTIANREALNFVFLLPLAVLAWKRIGYDSVILVTGWRDEWNTDPLYNDIFLICRKLGAVMIFLQSNPENNVMISQISKLFAANILHKEFHNQPSINEVYLLTTDTDIWPLNRSIYHLPDKYDVLSLNSFSWKPFTQTNTRYTRLHMTNIHVGAKISTWGKLTETNGTIPTTIDDMLSMFQLKFGSMFRKPVKKGQNMGWYLDQYMISIRVEKFKKDSRTSKTINVKFVGRDTRSDRIDLVSWSLPNGIQGKVDSHLLLNPFTPSVWLQVAELLRFMYPDKSPEYEFCVNYFNKYNERFSRKFNEHKN